MKKVFFCLMLLILLLAAPVARSQAKKVSTPCWSATLMKEGMMDTVTVTVRGKVYDQWGHPVAWAQLHLGTYTAATDDSGNFSFRHIPAGKYPLQVYGHCLPAKKKIWLKSGSIIHMNVFIYMREEHPESLGKPGEKRKRRERK